MGDNERVDVDKDDNDDMMLLTNADSSCLFSTSNINTIIYKK